MEFISRYSGYRNQSKNPSYAKPNDLLRAERRPTVVDIYGLAHHSDRSRGLFSCQYFSRIFYFFCRRKSPGLRRSVRNPTGDRTGDSSAGKFWCNFANTNRARRRTVLRVLAKRTGTLGIWCAAATD